VTPAVHRNDARRRQRWPTGSFDTVDFVDFVNESTPPQEQRQRSWAPAEGRHWGRTNPSGARNSSFIPIRRVNRWAVVDPRMGRLVEGASSIMAVPAHLV
jgi:hypothetical protein